MTGKINFGENMEKLNWPVIRIFFNAAFRYHKDSEVKFTKLNLDGVRAYLAECDNPDDSNVIVYIHGGGFVLGSAAAGKGYCATLAKYSGYRVVDIDYRLAPEHPFPAGFTDCLKAYGAVTRMYPDSKITLVGESAGGNLITALALHVDRSRISCVLANSPVVDFTSSLDRTEHEIDDYIVKVEALGPIDRMYIAGHDAKDPRISPIYGDFTDFPATFITCDSNESLYADSKALYQKLIEKGVDTEWVEMKGAFHAFANMGTQTPETQKILEEHIAFMKAHI